MEDSVNTRENGPLYFLVDNGSLRPEATINLRKIAQRLSERVGKRIEPVSLLHSHKIASDELGGESARILFPTMRAYLETGSSHFVLIPLFFGPSRALTEYIPGQVERLKARFPELKVTMAPTLVSIEDEDDCAMVEILQAQIDEVISAKQLVKPNVIMVDHGTPAKPVNAVRNFLGKQLAEMFDGVEFSVASMERRDGEAYDFNEPLLERLLGSAPFDRGPIVLSMLFLNPGRHAGAGGDIDAICAQAQKRFPELRICKTGLVGESPKLVDILARNFERDKTVIA